MGAEYRGELEILEVGFPAVTLKGGPVSLLSLESARNMNRRRDKYAHKGLFGHVLLIGGSPGMTGALILASTAALKSGAGLVTAATWDQNYSELTSRILPEIMTGRLPEDLEQISQKISFVNRYDAIVVGPGLGRSAMARQVVLGLLNHYPGPLVIDADGINALNIQEDGQTLYMRNAPTFLTPHVGEFARFTGKPVEDILARPLESLKELVSSINCSVLLKGPCSFLGRSSGEINLSYYPNDSLATAGSGDVLAGLLGGLFAQNAHNKTHQNLYHTYNLYDDAACVGLMAHSLAGKHARISCGGRGSSAGLIIDKLADAFKELETIA
jgi:NAD(P)H-hydrate epimerase